MIPPQPILNETARRLGHIEEPNSGATAGVLPSHLARQANQFLLAGQGELEIDLASARYLIGLDRSAALAEVGQKGVHLELPWTSDSNGRDYRGAETAAAFAAREALGSAQTDAGALERARSI